MPTFSPAQLRARRDGWTPERQVRFVEALAESGCVEEACAAVGMSRQSAYGLRTRIDAQGFRMAWDAAIELAIRRLSDVCLSRALNGDAVPHFYKGELIGEHRRYDNRLAMFLLRYRDPLRYAASLDQMVYSGHPENAAFAFARARDRAEEEAEGIADGAPPATDPAPWRTTSLPEAKTAAIEEALIDGDGKVNGSFERRERIYRLRREKHGARWAEESRREQAERDGAFTMLCEALEKTAAEREKAASGGDVPSTLSTSAPDRAPDPDGRARSASP